jgi:hypothetical protein
LIALLIGFTEALKPSHPKWVGATI